MRKVLFIGGTGTISMSIVKRLSSLNEWDVWTLNRGNRADQIPSNVHSITADMNDESDVLNKLEGIEFDVVCEFIGFKKGQVERDYRLFAGRTKQYIYTSSASAYHKPASSPFITEGTSLANPFWQYSRDKIECEEFLMKMYRENGFPVTIVRPSHTYDERKLPVGVHGKNGSWQVLQRMIEGKPVIIPGDGSSLWTVTHARDFAVGYTGLMGNVHAIGEAFQITGDEVLTWNQIYKTIADGLHVELHAFHVASDFLAAVGPQYDLTGELLGDKATSVIFDNRKLKKLVPEMHTRISFDTGVDMALTYIMKNPDTCQIPDPEFDAWCDHVIEVQEMARVNF